ncbi:MAG: T9SS type A sorting domain-containing protein, partial [Phaeodactylibacter sp.]|nr:T9SS type A sorting domain-containing protein [Phaeodactylibacter sp.]
DVDCDDNDPNITTQPGDACNDGDPNTFGETIQADCSCGGGSTGMAPAITCSRINDIRNDAEEQPTGQIRMASPDLELAQDPNSGNQVVGLRFDNLGIPQGAYITSARIQFTVEDTNNANPAQLAITGEASDDPNFFQSNMQNVSNRPRTNAVVQWMPSEWTSAGDDGFAQQTPDLSRIIQEIVNRNGFSTNSAIVLIIEGEGRRSAESFEGYATKAPQLCIEYLLMASNTDCPVLSGNFGEPCDDGNPNTYNDYIDDNCNCTGIPVSCPGQGSPCDDGDPNTIGETIQDDCSCGGGSPSPSYSCARPDNSFDDAAESSSGQVTLNSTSFELGASLSQGSQLTGIRFNGLNIPAGAEILKARIQFTAGDSQNQDLCELKVYGEASDNSGPFTSASGNISSRPATNAMVTWLPSAWDTPGAEDYAQQTPDLSPILQEIVNRPGYTSASSVTVMIEGIGRRAAFTFDGSASAAPRLCVEYLLPANASKSQPENTGAIDNQEEEEELPPIASDSAPMALRSLSVYPNPATDRLWARFTSDIDGKAYVMAKDMSGKSVMMQVRAIHQGENTILLDELHLPAGVYALQIFSGSSVQATKFVVLKE